MLNGVEVKWNSTVSPSMMIGILGHAELGPVNGVNTCSNFGKKKNYIIYVQQKKRVSLRIKLYKEEIKPFV